MPFFLRSYGEPIRDHGLVRVPGIEGDLPCKFMLDGSDRYRSEWNLDAVLSYEQLSDAIRINNQSPREAIEVTIQICPGVAVVGEAHVDNVTMGNHDYTISITGVGPFRVAP